MKLRVFHTLALVLAILVICFPNSAPGEEPAPSAHFLRAAYQWGPVLQTNDFLKGDNSTGKPIDSHQSLRLEYGRRTDGSRDWHHLYNFPSYGIGLYGADFDNKEELGTPTSLYGFFSWPLRRSGPWLFSFDLGFGLATNWESYDPVHNPNNIAIGLGRSVHIEVGANVAYRLARHWSLIGGLSGLHFSNGGTQRPNNGLNAAGIRFYTQYDLGESRPLPVRREVGPADKSWDYTFTGSWGVRNLNLKFDDPTLRGEYLNRNYTIINFTLALGRKFSHKSRYCLGLDMAYDESVGDLIELDAYNQGRNDSGEFSDNLELATFGGYEIIAHRTHLILHLGYIFLRNDVEGRLPRFYQRLGVKQFFLRDFFAGLNVRFHELGSADNLEWNLGHVSSF